MAQKGNLSLSSLSHQNKNDSGSQNTALLSTPTTGVLVICLAPGASGLRMLEESIEWMLRHEEP